MSKIKSLIITLCIMFLLAAVLVAVVRLFPASLIYILGVFAVPGFIACGSALYVWIITPESKHSCITKRRKEIST